MCARRSVDRWRVGPLPAANAEEEREALIDGSDLFPLKLTEHAADPPLVDRSQMIDQREGLLGQAATTGREGWIEEPLTRSPRYRHHAHERKALITDDVRIA